jgi:hypothetical protein
MVIFTDIKTGERIILPTPDDKEVDIDTLPAGEPLTDEEVNEWFKFHNKKCDIHGKTYPVTQKITQRIHRLFNKIWCSLSMNSKK